MTLDASVALGYLLGGAKRLTPREARSRAARLFDGSTDFIERLAGVRNSLTPPVRIRLHIGPILNPRVYRASAERDVEGFRALAALKPSDRFLDIGCGCGRLAAALTGYLDAEGLYEGFDTAKEPVEWCRRNITPRFPIFHFTSTDTISGRYNPSGSKRARDLIFPYESGLFDFAFSGSVYIHMVPEEIKNFLAETARVLRPGGVALATFCLLNERTLPLVTAMKSTLKLPYQFGECRVRSIADPTRFIGHPESLIRRLYSEAGLKIVGDIRYGRWALPPSEVAPMREQFFSQDVVLATK